MTGKVRWVLPIGGAVLLAAAVVIGVVAPRLVALSLVAGVFGIIGITVAIGAPLRRPGSPQGPYWRLIAYGVAGMVVGSLAVTLPPHSYLVGVLVMVLGVGCWCVGVGILGGGWFGIIGAGAAGLLVMGLAMAPTPVALSYVGVPVQCHVQGSDGRDVYDFTAVCPGGRTYAFNSEQSRDFPGGRVTVLVDPHGIISAEFVGEQSPDEDLPVAVGAVLVAAGVVVAAAYNRRRLRGRVAHVVQPPVTT